MVWCSVCLEIYHSWGTSKLYTWSTSLPSFYKRYCTRHWNIYTFFADDTSPYIIAEDPIVAAELLKSDLEKIAEWALKWLVKFNLLKTESILISRKPNTVHPPVFMRDQQIKEDESHKHLGVILSNDCVWQNI